MKSQTPTHRGIKRDGTRQSIELAFKQGQLSERGRILEIIDKSSPYLDDKEELKQQIEDTSKEKGK